MQLFSYQSLIQVEILNDYYKSLISPDFSFVPERNTARLMKGLGIRSMEKNGVLNFFADVDETGKLKNNQVSGSFKLVFFLKLNNPSYFNFTNLPFDSGNSKIYYFSNKASNEQEVFNTGADSLLLNQNTHTSDADQIVASRMVYSYIHDGDDGAKTADLVSVDNDGTVDSQELDSVDEYYNFQFKLNDLPVGMYKLIIDGGEVDRFYFTGEQFSNRHFAVLELFSQVPSSYRWFTNTNEVASKKYRIAFEHRKTTWRYQVFNRSEVDFSNPGVREADTPWEFTDIGNYVFVSDNPMPLKEASIKGIALLGKKNNMASVLIDNLPNPDPSLIKPDPGDPTTIYSDMYIYL
ncbi:hypothetical protein [uncultured Sunxiuqinia sp.]|uniref:hypothetical protein n=1 Tax=uncultured Sunxiuqinia sp. TaxID=1573825 RepID=UPI002AA6111F|nr:hypothetical protein [uncultured Sunxiuqinia sp.]